DVLARHLRGCLDVFSYRLDAWVTSLATRRLTELRQATPRGLTLGAFGWVQDLEASPREQEATVPAGGAGSAPFPAPEPGGVPPPSLSRAGLRRGRAAERLHRARRRVGRGPARDQPLLGPRSPRRVAHRRDPAGAAARRAARLPLRACAARAAARSLHRRLPA